jgi:hypothetical protein
LEVNWLGWETRSSLGRFKCRRGVRGLTFWWTCGRARGRSEGGWSRDERDWGFVRWGWRRNDGGKAGRRVIPFVRRFFFRSGSKRRDRGRTSRRGGRSIKTGYAGGVGRGGKFKSGKFRC